MTQTYPVVTGTTNFENIFLNLNALNEDTYFVVLKTCWKNSDHVIILQKFNLMTRPIV